MSKVFKFQVVDNLFRKNTKTINAYCEVQGDKLIMVKEYTLYTMVFTMTP